MNSADVEKILEYKFSKPELLRLALTHPSCGMPNNQRLEFLGDAVLQVCVSEKLYNEMPNAPEGVMTRKRALMVQERALYSAAVCFGIGDYLVLGKGERNAGGQLRASILADTMEALIGAIFMDGGFDRAKAFVIKMLANMETDTWRDYKTELQEYTQSLVLGVPEYEIIDQSGPAHDRSFIAGVSISGDRIATGSGKTKKDAEQSAAKTALSKLNTK
ncbi:MAG: ribonuclease III [Clostridia bacterium]|nr:ribonuclease III [Clostridia bacterium]